MSGNGAGTGPKQFSPADIIANADGLSTFSDSVLGEIKYGRLTKAEFEAVQAETSSQEAKLNKMMFLMLKKAYPTLTLDNLDAFPIDVVFQLKTIFSARLAPFLKVK
jgi:hypothetical protein